MPEDAKSWIGRIKYRVVDKIRRRRLSYPPICPKLHIELTNKCNLDCIICDRKSLQRELGMMDFSLFKRIIDNAADFGIPEIKLNRFGESTLHPELSEMISYTKKKGIPLVYINTNGTLFDEKYCKEIIESGLDSIMFSVDGATADTFEKVRRNASYDEVESNIHRFVRMRTERGLYKPEIILNTVLSRDTQPEIVDFFRKWSSVVDVINVLPVFQYANLADFSTVDKPSITRRGPCFQPFKQMMIFWDGEVTVCGGDINGDLSIGNVSISRLEELWTNEKMSYVRNMHRGNKFNTLPLCGHCDGTNKGYLGERMKIINRTYEKVKELGLYEKRQNVLT